MVKIYNECLAYNQKQKKNMLRYLLFYGDDLLGLTCLAYNREIKFRNRYGEKI